MLRAAVEKQTNPHDTWYTVQIKHMGEPHARTAIMKSARRWRRRAQQHQQQQRPRRPRRQQRRHPPPGPTPQVQRSCCCARAARSRSCCSPPWSSERLPPAPWRRAPPPAAPFRPPRAPSPWPWPPAGRMRTHARTHAHVTPHPSVPPRAHTQRARRGAYERLVRVPRSSEQRNERHDGLERVLHRHARVLSEILAHPHVQRVQLLAAGHQQPNLHARARPNTHIVQCSPQDASGGGSGGGRAPRGPRGA